MRITLNGKTREVRGGIFLLVLLAELKLKPESIMIELNRACIDRKQMATLELREGDSLEIIRLVGGG